MPPLFYTRMDLTELVDKKALLCNEPTYKTANPFNMSNVYICMCDPPLLVRTQNIYVNSHNMMNIDLFKI